MPEKSQIPTLVTSPSLPEPKINNFQPVTDDTSCKTLDLEILDNQEVIVNTSSITLAGNVEHEDIAVSNCIPVEFKDTALAHIKKSEREIIEYSSRVVMQEGLGAGEVWEEIVGWVPGQHTLKLYLGYIMRGASEAMAGSMVGLTRREVEEMSRRHEGFRYARRVARAFKDVKRVGVIQTSADLGDWKAAAWLLERDGDSADYFEKAGGEGGGVVVNNVVQNNKVDVGSYLKAAWEKVQESKMKEVGNE